jgi:hypothetical protein
MRALILATFVGLLALLSTASTRADDSAEYTRVIKEAVVEFDNGNWIEARVLFQRAHALNPNARTWRSLGLTAFELRRYVDAIAELEAALAEQRKPLNDKARAEVTQLLQRAREFVAVYRVSVQPEGAEVIVDGKSTSLRDGQLFLDPGSHSVIVRAPGYLEQRQDLKIDEPRREQLSIELKVAGVEEPQDTEAPVATAAPAAPAPAQTEARRPRVWTWVLGGAAVATGAVGLGLGLAAGSKNDDFKACESDCGSLKSKGQGLQLGANVSYGVAGGLLVGAVVAWFVEGKRSSTETPRTSFYVHPWGAGLHGRF